MHKRLTIAIYTILTLLSSLGVALALPCDIKPSTPYFISHDLNVSYCELCNYGYITIVIANPYEEADMVNMTVVEDLGISGLTYDSSAPPPQVTYSLNGGPPLAGGAPVISGTNGRTLTWTSTQISELSRLNYDPNINDYSTLSITFPVSRAGTLTEEGLISAVRQITADLTYGTEYVNPVPPPPFLTCPGTPVTVNTGTNTLALREPRPVVTKRGRNVDADQDSWSQTVYGNVNDDVIWRIRVRNNGSADLQDLRFDDLMQTGNIEIHYICPTAGGAAAVAANNGTDPGGTGCMPAGNTINDYDVDNPFGNPGDDNPDLVDVIQAGSGYIYLVGKIPTTPNGSCSLNRTNTVSDIQWGCEADSPPAGGITTTSTGYTPGNATSTLSTRSVNTGTNLSIQTRITGVSASQPAGSKARVRITIRNNTGGSVKDIDLRNILPVEYVVDPTYTPAVTAFGAYGYYPGLTNRIEWTNPAPGTYPLTTTDPAVALSNTAPEFTLTSSEAHPIYADQENMLRHGDRLEITFGVILIRPQSYDRVADLDVRTESPTSTPPDTDPDNDILLTNRLFVEFEDFCDIGTRKTPPTNPLVTTHQSDPEDLDINIAGSELVFILTGDPAQRLPLTVDLTNNGGHDADDYVAYITFGQTMNVVTVPTGCVLTTNPPPLDEWQLPAPIPAGAAVYQYTGSPIAPGSTRSLTFEVLKSTVPGDIAADDLTFRADTIGEITLNDGTLLWFPTPVNPRTDGGTDRANNYSLDGIRARVIGFNLLKSQVGYCSENNTPPPPLPDIEVQIGEECTYHIETGGWFGFQTPGFTFVAVQSIQVVDELPDGQGYISSTDPLLTSTPAITGISLNPPGLLPVDEGWIDWTFNTVVPGERITQRDHWFRVDMVSRLLNDPIDVSAAPNQHADLSTNTLNSYFQAVFDNAGVEEVYDLGPNTVGYPRVEVRRFSLIVTEPDITVVKEVCNESLYGSGTGCSNWVSLADDGDAYDSYIYRLTLTNEAGSGGVTRAPAYDVIVTDQLDASDLAYVLPFAGDGLDNDGDGAVGGADTNGEGTISDNIVNNATPAVITFSHTHSSALERINPGQSVQLYYRVDFDDDAAPLQTFTNSADAIYDTLTGASGNQTVDQRPNSDIGGARVYTCPADTASVRIIPVLTQPKRITAISNTPPVGGGGTQGVSIGEEIEYRLNTLLPVALLRNFVIRDELPAGLRCIEVPVIDLDAPPYSAAGFVPGGTITPTCVGGVIEWNFGDQRVTNGTVGNPYDFEIGFIARVENTAITNDADVLSNGDPTTTVTASYIDEAGNPVVLYYGQVDALVREPRMDLTKAFAVTTADAADVLTVSVTATNNGTATAYNLRVLDDLTGTDMTFTGTVGGANPPDNIDTTTFGVNSPIFSWNAPNGIDPAASISFTFNVSVDNVVQPLEVLDNTIQADWTSLPGHSTALNSTGIIGPDGSEDGMRIGALPNAGHAVNDYETDAGAFATVPPVTVIKTDLDTAVIPAIGAHKHFRIDISLPEGITRDVLVTDSLNTAGISYFLENNSVYDITYTFQGIATINGAAPGESAFNGFPADNTSGSAVWNIGTVVTLTENDPTQSAIAPLIRIEYYVRVNNDLVTDDTDTLQNSVDVNHTHGETGAPETITDDTAAVTVVEPLLTATKTWINITDPGNPAEGGDVLEFEVTFLNSGTSTAHDVNVVDTLPSGLPLYTGFTPTATINGSAVAGFIATPANSPDGPLIWGRDNGDDSLDIPSGQDLVLTYRVFVQELSGSLSNSVYADWTSLDGTSSYERTGAGCPGTTAPDDYCTGPAVATIPTNDDNSISKAITADTYDVPPLSTATDGIARVGDTITYRLALNLRGGLTRNVRVDDVLPTGVAFIDVVSINGDTTAAYTPPASGPGSNFAYAPITTANVPSGGQTGTLTWTIGNVMNDPFGDPTTDILEIIYRAIVMPDAGIVHVASTTLTNTATLSYTGAPTLTGSADLTLHQPIIAQVTKVTTNGFVSPANVDVVNDIMAFRLEACNTGSAPAYSIAVTDQLATQLDETSIANLVVSANGVILTAGSDYTYTSPAVRGGTMHFLLTAPVNPGECLIIDYDIGFYSDFGPNQTWNNSVVVDSYWSLPAQSGQLYGPVGPAVFTMTNNTTIEPPAKTIVTPASALAAIGDLIVYRVTVPSAPMNAALHDVRILDNLSTSAADLFFIGIARVSGSQPWTPVNTGTATNLVIEDTTNGIDIPAGEQIAIDITVRLADTPANVHGLTFINSASYTYNRINNNPASREDGGSDDSPIITIIGPDLTMEKTGPANMQFGTPATFTLNVHNTDMGAAWNVTLTDQLPNGATGGTCDTGPSNVTAQFFLADGTTPVGPPLVQGTNFDVVFTGDPTCEWTISLLSAAGGLEPDRRLIVNYDLTLDSDTQNNVPLTNVAGATQWFSIDPDIPGSVPRTYTRVLTDGTVGTLDHEDAHTINTEAPVLTFEKTVINVTTGQDPGSNAGPGDTLRYTILLTNNGPVGLPSFTITDDLGDLNTPPVFVAGSLNLISFPAGADTSATDPLGGTNGTGLVNVANLSIGAQGSPNDTVTVVFEITLLPVISSGTVVLNRAELTAPNFYSFYSDDPNLPGDEDPTETLISSAPVFQVHKISTYMSGDPTVLMAGETLRYTITIKNIGNENAVNVSLRDFTPSNTTYVANSTTLNGNAIPDAGPGINPLHTGILINAPENTTPGYMRADVAPGADNVATVIFDVVVDPSAMDGLIIENQGYVSGSGEGSGVQPEQPSDDPGTPAPDDPTRDVVGNLPLLYAHKTVALFTDLGTIGIVDPGDTLIYTIVISNNGAAPATSVVLTDAVPNDTTYVVNSLRLNGVFLGPDGGVLPLIAGLPVHSSDNPGAGIVSVGETAVITFQSTVNGGVPTGTIISNQGDLTSAELPPALTDADNLPANGYQPTVIVVGDAQLLTITKEVFVVGGGPALPGGQLEYVVRAVNNGTLPATRVFITDDLNPPLGTQVSYVAGSGTLNGAAAGVTYLGGILTADYNATYGDLPSGASAVLRFRVLINAGLAIGTTITNTGVVHWNNPEQTASASVSIDVGGTPGSSALNGNAWHDTNFDTIQDSGEIRLTGWTVTLYRNSIPVTTVLTDDSGTYRLSGLLPNAGTSDQYEIRFRARGAGANAASLGYADSVFTDGPHRISDIIVSDGGNLQNLNLPITPNGTVYNSVLRVPIAGATVTMLNAATGAPCPGGCFDGPFQQNQVTAAEGYYKFDMNFSDGGCPAGGAYLIEVTPPATGYRNMPSLIIPPANDATTPPFSVPVCPGDAIPIPPGYCEIVVSPAVPPVSVPPRTDGTIYYLHLLLDSGSMPGSSQIFNNPIPIDPEMDGAVAITKTSSKINVTRGALVPYTITVTNVYGVPLYDIGIIDRFPAGFKYVAGSARLNDKPFEPRIDGRLLAWDGLEMQVDNKIIIKFLLVVGSGVSEGDYVNRAQVRNNAIGEYISGEATATVRVIPDPDFDCTDVIGKVFDDLNLNGRQDPGEKGLAGARVVTARGLIVTTDEHGRFHITCAAVPDFDRGSNFILKLDERSLPTGYRLTTENPRVQRATRGKMIRFNFGATIHRVVRIDITDGVFEPDTCDLRMQWKPKIDQLLKELKKAPSVLRLSYLADIEPKGLVIKRLNALKKTVSRRWKKSKDGYPLDIETEIYWRRGAPVNGRKR